MFLYRYKYMKPNVFFFWSSHHSQVESNLILYFIATYPRNFSTTFILYYPTHVQMRDKGIKKKGKKQRKKRGWWWWCTTHIYKDKGPIAPSSLKIARGGGFALLFVICIPNLETNIDSPFSCIYIYIYTLSSGETTHTHTPSLFVYGVSCSKIDKFPFRATTSLSTVALWIIIIKNKKKFLSKRKF